MKAPVRFIGTRPSDDTVSVLSELFSKAGTGECIGLAVVAHYKGRKFEIFLTGEAGRSPIYTLGTIRLMEQTVLTHSMIRRS